MFVRKNKNRSGSISVQIATKVRRKYQLVRTVGTAHDPDTIAVFIARAKREIATPPDQGQLFNYAGTDTLAVRNFLAELTNANIRLEGPELIFGTLFDRIGFADALPHELFRHLVIARLCYPGSKLKTATYLRRARGVTRSVQTIYRFLDTLEHSYKEIVEETAYRHTKKRLGEVTVAFYDMTTLYFESDDEDDLRKIGWSKDGKFHCPQIMLGLLLGADGFPIGYDFFEGNTWEGNTLLPMLEKFSERYNITKPVVVADAGLLSKENIAALTEAGYPFILGGRIKNETDALKTRILADLALLHRGIPRTHERSDGSTLLVAWSYERAKKDAYNRERGLRRLETALKRGALTKAALNKRGYNKFLKLDGHIAVSLDHEKVKDDAAWDGLKGYVTTADIPPEDVIARYGDLWRIERAFRISKTDLKVRPVFHRLRNRISAHLLIAFVAYAIAVEFEQLALKKGTPMSVRHAAELTHTMYALAATLPGEANVTTTPLRMDEEQRELYDIIHNTAP